MGGKDSPPPTVLVDAGQQHHSLLVKGSPPHSPVRCSSVASSPAVTCPSTASSSCSSSPASSPGPDRKISPSIRYVPRSKSAVNLELYRDVPSTASRERSGSVISYSPVQAYIECLTPQSLKCVIVGDSGTGKTAMLMSYTMEKFIAEHTPTIYDKFSTSLSVHGKRINMTLCDTSGADDFGHLRPLCYPQADVALICFSVTDYSSFENARNKWIKELKRHCPGVPVILVGTHTDKRDTSTLLRDFKSASRRYVSRSEGLRAASNMKAVTYIECSPRTHYNVKAVFDEAIATVMELNSSKINKPTQCIGAGCTIL